MKKLGKYILVASYIVVGIDSIKDAISDAKKAWKKA